MFQDFHKIQPEGLQVFCSSVLFGIKIDVINLLIAWWFGLFVKVDFCREIWKSAFKQQLILKGGPESLSGNFWACSVEVGVLMGIPCTRGFF